MRSYIVYESGILNKIEWHGFLKNGILFLHAKAINNETYKTHEELSDLIQWNTWGESWGVGLEEGIFIEKYDSDIKILFESNKHVHEFVEKTGIELDISFIEDTISKLKDDLNDLENIYEFLIQS